MVGRVIPAQQVRSSRRMSILNPGMIFLLWIRIPNALPFLPPKEECRPVVKGWIGSGTGWDRLQSDVWALSL
jgi:hypothetical protein